MTLQLYSMTAILLDMSGNIAISKYIGALSIWSR